MDFLNGAYVNEWMSWLDAIEVNSLVVDVEG